MTAAPVYAATAVSYVEPTVLILTTPFWLGVNEYHTLPAGENMLHGCGSPDSNVASSVDCVLV